MVKVTIVPVVPTPVPEDTVILEMSKKKAQALQAILGAFSILDRDSQGPTDLARHEIFSALYDRLGSLGFARSPRPEGVAPWHVRSGV